MKSTADVEKFLAQLLASEISELEVLPGGDWSQAYGFESGGKDLVARFGKHEDDFVKDRAASQFSCANMPVPGVLYIVPCGALFCCVSERLYGNRIEDASAAEMEKLIPAVLQLWDALRGVDVDAWNLAVGRPTCSWREQLLSVDEENDRVYGWHDKIATSPVGLEPFRSGLEFMKGVLDACPPDRHLLHNDLLHYNVLVRGDKITAVFDWGCASLGDFLYDLAMFQFYRPWFPSMACIDWAAEAKAHYRKIGLEVPELEARMLCYQVHVGLAGMGYCGFVDDVEGLQQHAIRLQEITSLA